MKKLLDPDDPFFAPAWKRWATALLPLIWGAVEFLVFQDPLWGLIFAAAGAFAFWQLIVKGPAQP